MVVVDEPKGLWVASTVVVNSRLQPTLPIKGNKQIEVGILLELVSLQLLLDGRVLPLD